VTYDFYTVILLLDILVISAVPFPTFCSACEVSCVIVGCFNHFCYLLTYTVIQNAVLNNDIFSL